MPIITADKRDITQEEWRIIPGFSKYKVTKDGDVWGRTRQTLLRESHHQKNDTYYYHLHGDDGKKTTRTFQSLVDLAFPELAAPKPVKPPKVRKRPAYRKPDDWVDVPGFDRYQISKDGGLRYKKNRQVVKPKDGKVTLLASFDVQDLIELTFDSEEEAA